MSDIFLYTYKSFQMENDSFDETGIDYIPAETLSYPDETYSLIEVKTEFVNRIDDKLNLIPEKLVIGKYKVQIK